jgi:hypothetical protein
MDSPGGFHERGLDGGMTPEELEAVVEEIRRGLTGPVQGAIIDTNETR